MEQPFPMKNVALLRRVYAIISVILFAIEVAIARGMIGGDFVRASIGDLLVIALIYFFLRGVFFTPAFATAAFSVLFGFVVEGLQFFHIADLLGLQKGEVLYIVIGNTFQLGDFVMYVIGGSLAYWLDVLLLSKVLTGSARDGSQL